MKILVCGSRDYSDAATLFTTMGQLQVSHGPFDLLMHGGATGADSMAGDWGCAFGIPVQVYRADWGTYRKAAGPVRNAKMLAEGKPDLVVAFPSGLLHDSKGTRDMVTKATVARVRTYVVYDGALYTADGHAVVTA